MPTHSIVGITGTLGAGKGTVVAYLTQKLGYQHYSVRDYLTTLIERRGMPLNRDSMVAVANELRAKHSPSFIVEQLLQEARDTQGASSFIIESIRTEGEVTALRALAPDSFKLFAVDADAKLRYTRVHERGTATDHVTLDEFLANEAREMHATDPTKQNLARCIEIADAKFMNDGSLEQLWEQVQAALPAIVPGPSA